jgi:hypothetical protein
LTTSKLSVLIASLASGADTFGKESRNVVRTALDSAEGGNNDTNNDISMETD